MPGDDESIVDEAYEQLSEDRERRVEDLGRRAGAALRRPAPADGAEAVMRRSRNRRVVHTGAAIGMATVLVIGIVVISRGGDAQHEPVTTVTDQTLPEPVRVVPTNISNGWVAFTANDNGDVYLVREGTPARRIAGSDGDAIEQVCPAFSPDGTRLAHGHSGALVITDLTADGVPSATATIGLEGTTLAPCATWSADGRWLAFGIATRADPLFVDEVWVVDADTAEIRRLSVLAVTDLEWAPDTTELFIASDGGIVVYSVEGA